MSPVGAGGPDAGKRLAGPHAIGDAQFQALADRSRRDEAQVLGVSRSVVHRPQIVRRTGIRLVHFAFTGVIDAHGFAVYEQQTDAQ